MANEETKVFTRSWAMTGGDGPRSYTQNSSYQKGVVDAAKKMVNQGIKDKLDFKSPSFDSSNNTFGIADFGCSVGPNTFFAVDNIIEAVEHKYQAQFPNSPPLEFQIFFNDVATNDFNTLFRILPSYQNYFAAGVPGTFVGRLFPKSTLHLAHSSNALHWLSKVPKEVVDSKSPAWNKGSIVCSGTAKEVTKAYSAQFKNDIDTFLNARAQEIVCGGLMIILITCIPDGILMSQAGIGIYYDLLGSCLTDMAKLGVISEEKADSFNLPVYYPHAKELEENIKINGYFSIERMDRLNHPWQTIPSIEVSSSTTRAVFHSILLEHLGSEDVVDKIFEHFAKKHAENVPMFDGVIHQSIDFFFLLKRNSN